MTVGPVFLAVMVLLALAVTTLTPAILIILWIKDWKSKRLW